MRKHIKTALLELVFCVLFYGISQFTCSMLGYNVDQGGFSTMTFFGMILFLNIVRGFFEYAVFMYGKDVRNWWIIFNKKNFISWDALYRITSSEVFIDDRMKMKIKAMLDEYGIPPTDYYYHTGRGLYFRKDHLRTLFLLKYGN